MGLSRRTQNFHQFPECHPSCKHIAHEAPGPGRTHGCASARANHPGSPQQLLSGDGKALRGHRPGPTVVTSHQQIPKSISRIAYNFAFIYIFSQWTNVGFGGKIQAVTGKAPFEQRFSGSLGEEFVSAVYPQIFLPSSVCSATFPWEILKGKPGLFFV